MKKLFIPIWIGLSAMTQLTGCSGSHSADLKPVDSKKSAIESAFDQRAKIKGKYEHAGLLSGQLVAGLKATDVRNCPADFRSAWFDYLVQVENLHTRITRVAMFASGEGKPVTDLPALIKFGVTHPTLGQYPLSALDKTDEAWEKLERTAMNYGVMPER